VRIVRACHDLGMRAVAVYSEVDRAALHVRLADEAYPIGEAAPAKSYLSIERILGVARRAGCDAVHPGYGFLAENAAFAEAVAASGITFVGPPADVQRLLGEKTAARRLAARAGVPVAEGSAEALADEASARREADRIGYPVLLKPAGGGGGKGMRVVRSAAELTGAWRGATGEAQTAFGAPAMLLERYLAGARHIEMQLVADRHGALVWLGERDCSVQRRHQKLIEETPGPSVDARLREALGDAALRIARAAGYVNAGTAEFLVDAEGRFVFLEMNTRLQVEHPVTEVVTGLDLVALQFRVAAGEPLPFGQADVAPRGAAIECRVTAESAFDGFMPQGGRVGTVREPAGPGIRVDSALAPGAAVPTEYDPLLCKLVAAGPTRDTALARMRRAVAETVITGVPTTLPFHRHVLAEPDFSAGRYDTSYVEAHWPPRDEEDLEDGAVAAAAAVGVLVSARRRPAPASGPSAWARRAREEAVR
jgi:acetyl-CoA carboxylase, biotin carboxylase subunit